MENLSATFYGFGIAAASVTIIAGVFTTFVQISKLPRGWHAAPLAMAVAVAPPVLNTFALVALYLGGVPFAAGLLSTSLLMHAVGFARLPEPSGRKSIAWFVVVSVVIGTSIPAIFILDLVGRVLDAQSRIVDAQSITIDAVGRSIDILEQLVGAPAPD